MVEARILSQMQVTEAMVDSGKNVLHLDGVVTPSVLYTLSVEDMLSG